MLSIRRVFPLRDRRVQKQVISHLCLCRHLRALVCGLFVAASRQAVPSKSPLVRISLCAMEGGGALTSDASSNHRIHSPREIRGKVCTVENDAPPCIDRVVSHIHRRYDYSSKTVLFIT